MFSTKAYGRSLRKLGWIGAWFFLAKGILWLAGSLVLFGSFS
jgi:hypothetical protein